MLNCKDKECSTFASSMHRPSCPYRSAASAGYKPNVLQTIWLNKFASHGQIAELRFDWSNDRHQSVTLNGLDPESIKNGLLEAAQLLNKEIKSGCL